MAHSTNENPVEWPARAVVTAGMPYGNKPLHFGHVGGVRPGRRVRALLAGPHRQG